MSFRENLVHIIPDLRVFARSRMKNLPGADDLVQKTLLRAIEKQARFKGGSLIAWSITIMKNIMIDDCRKVTGYDFVELDPDQNDDSPSGQENLVQVSEVNDAMYQLGEICREILVLIGAGYSYNEISETLLVPKGTVMSRLARCREQLVEKLSEA